MKRDHLRILSQTEIDYLFSLDKKTLANILDEIIKEVGHNPCYNPCIYNKETTQQKTRRKKIASLG